MATDCGWWAPSRARRAKGFTLIELMIVVAIIALLATIANASYSSYAVKTRRAAAATCLEERALFMERYYTTKLTYVGAPDPAQCSNIEDFYEIALDSATSKAFKLTATPTSKQNDEACGTLSINAKGQRGATGTNGATCW